MHDTVLEAGFDSSVNLASDMRVTSDIHVYVKCMHVTSRLMSVGIFSFPSILVCRPWH